MVEDDIRAPFVDLVSQSDMAVINISFGAEVIWINKSKPEVAYGSSVPKNTFPFARLASVTTLDNQTTYLYHQMNGTTFAEESFEASVGEWGDPTYIHVAPLP